MAEKSRAVSYRAKVALSLVGEIGEPIARTRFQKLLFLLGSLQDEPSYKFVPDHYGCYSFVSANDRKKLVSAGILDSTYGGWRLQNPMQLYDELKGSDRRAIRETSRKFGKYTTTDLLRYVYREYPYYSLNSRIKQRFADNGCQRPSTTDHESGDAILTIGYEGSTIEEFINQLVEANVQTVIDVRKNPISRKFGFSKTKLRTFLSSMGIGYSHFRDLGIPSDTRRSFLDVDDRPGLLEWYRVQLPQAFESAEEELIKSFESYKNPALLCFEKSSHDCHRSVLAEYISIREKKKIINM
jgi:uncharacterized protein (DUF488 family)